MAEENRKNDTPATGGESGAGQSGNDTPTIEQLMQKMSEMETQFKTEISTRDKAVTKFQKEAEEKQRLLDEEKEKNMTEQQLAGKKAQDLLDKAAAAERRVLEADITLASTKALTEAKIPLEFSQFVKGESVETTLESISELKALLAKMKDQIKADLIAGSSMTPANTGNGKPGLTLDEEIKRINALTIPQTEKLAMISAAKRLALENKK